MSETQTTTAITKHQQQNSDVVEVTAIEKALLQGDLSSLSPPERIAYYRSICRSLELNELTRPFEYITFQGKLVLYARRDCADQLRSKRGLTTKIVGRERADDLLVVTARVTDKTGREEDSIGALFVGGLRGEALANAMMKCETKAKRRATLSFCGLGILDETEIEEGRAIAQGVQPLVAASPLAPSSLPLATDAPPPQAAAAKPDTAPGFTGDDAADLATHMKWMQGAKTADELARARAAARKRWPDGRPVALQAAYKEANARIGKAVAPAPQSAPTKPAACDGQHGDPPCGAPECWLAGPPEPRVVDVEADEAPEPGSDG